MSFCFAHLHLTSNQRGKGPITTSTLANPVNDGILNFCFTLTRELRWLRARSCTHTYRRSAAAHRRRAVVAGSHSACNLSQRPSFRPCLPPSLPSSLPPLLLLPALPPLAPPPAYRPTSCRRRCRPDGGRSSPSLFPIGESVHREGRERREEGGGGELGRRRADRT